MLRLAYRDIFIYQRKNLIVLFAFGIYFPLIFSKTTTDIASILGVMAIFSIIMISQTAFSYDEAYKFNKFLKALPISTSKIAASRYLACIAAAIIGSIWTLIAVNIINLLPASVPLSGFDGSLSLEGVITAMGTALLTAAVIMPLMFKFGFVKLRYIMMMIMILVITMLPSLLNSSNAVIQGTLKFLGSNFIITFALCVMLLVASIFLSSRILRKKEY